MSFAREALTLLSLLAVAAGVSASGESSLISVGASLPARLYRNWFAQMASSGGPEVSYRSVGSASAQWALIRPTVDFAVFDAPMQSKDLAKVRRGVVQMPIAAAPLLSDTTSQGETRNSPSSRLFSWPAARSPTGSSSAMSPGP